MHQTRHDMDQLAAGGFRIAEGQCQIGIEILLAAGQRRAPTLSRGCVARGGIEQGQREAVGLETGCDLGGRRLVGVADLDALEARLRRRLEAVEKRQLGEQEIQVGAKAEHVSPLACRSEGLVPAIQRATRAEQADGWIPVTSTGMTQAQHHSVNPPSGVIDEPVMYFNSSDAR